MKIKSSPAASLIVCFALLFITGLRAQITTDLSFTPQQLVQNVLLGPGIIASNITYTGYANSISKFTALNTGLGIDSGIYLSSGSSIANDPLSTPGFPNSGPFGPNLINQTSEGIDVQQPGDPDLNTLTTNSTFDASILAFDFVAMSDSVKFRYVFASEEYSDYANSTFNDVFGFFLSGVSVTLTSTNIAIIPNTSVSVAINNVNNGNNNGNNNLPAPGPCMNCAYFRDNYCTSGNVDCQFDGLTTVLTASYPVQCGETYHIKLGVADVLDHVFDSGVFLEAGSFRAGEVNVSAQISYGSNNDTTLFEGCGQACLVLNRTGNSSGTDTAFISVGGTSTNGVDFIPTIPPYIVFPPGQDSVVLCLQAVQDNTAEGIETLVMNTATHGICVQNLDSIKIYLNDAVDIVTDIGNDTSMCSSNPIPLNSVTTGGVEPYTYTWSTGATTPGITVNPTTTTSYILTVSDQCGTPVGQDTVTVFLPNVGALSATASPDLTLCDGLPAVLDVNFSGGSQPYTVTWTTVSGPDQLPNPNGNFNQFTPTGSGVFHVVIHEGCGDTVGATVNVTVNECTVIPPNVFTPNSDGTNDVLVFDGLDRFTSNSLEIYNRWGNKIYETTNYKNDWNGNGISDGTYYYILTYSDGTTSTTISGFFTSISK